MGDDQGKRNSICMILLSPYAVALGIDRRDALHASVFIVDGRCPAIQGNWVETPDCIYVSMRLYLQYSE